MRRGQHLFRHNATISVIDLSCAKSECYAFTKGGCSGLGLQSLFADWNLELQLSLCADSSSAKAISSRSGTGKSTRHIQTRMLRLQERIAAKHLRVVKSSIRIKSCIHVDESPWKIENLGILCRDWTN